MILKITKLAQIPIQELKAFTCPTYPCQISNLCIQLGFKFPLLCQCYKKFKAQLLQPFTAKNTQRPKTGAIDELKRRKFYSSPVARWTAIYLAAITPSFSTGHFQRALKSPRRAKLFQ